MPLCIAVLAFVTANITEFILMSPSPTDIPTTVTLIGRRHHRPPPPHRPMLSLPDGYNPLFVATVYGSWGIVKILLNAGANPMTKCFLKGTTSLSWDMLTAMSVCKLPAM
jgi:hypothetical protein